ncbi:hypothetical protein Leryth_002130 [Lithospermum erythrorhizon]|nr:hypothetical protein Leryth_002130 [Lithospermum erythrorhizon]
MMRPAGSCLFASLTSVPSVILKNHSRYSLSLFATKTSRSRKACIYCQKYQLHTDSKMTMGSYLPPWFSHAVDNLSKRKLDVKAADKAQLFFIKDRFLDFGPEQHPIVLQIGGNNLDNLAKATQLANPYVVAVPALKRLAAVSAR